MSRRVDIKKRIQLSPRKKNGSLWICTGLVLSVLAAYAPTWENRFNHFDDQGYITENSHVQQGWTLESLRWAFTTGETGNWAPVTWMSHMTDVMFFGLDPRGHHAVNLLFHACNAILFFWFLRKTTGWFWPAAFAAAVFALHPIQVESVAWASERKNVLSTFFFLLALLAYERYSRRPGIKGYLLVTGVFLMGLMSKVMLVTFPFVLLLLDVWPLGRWSSRRREPAGKGPAAEGTGAFPVRSPSFLILEKIPWLVMAAIFSVIAYHTQQAGGAMLGGDYLIFPRLLSHALISYISYLGKWFFPHNLACLYPYPRTATPLWKPLLATGVLLLITFLLLIRCHRRKWLPVGWFFFLGTLVPVIGLVQIGVQAIADRYMYVPSLGLLFILAGAVAEGFKSFPRATKIGAFAAGAVLILLGGLTFRQTKVWKDDLSLSRQALQVTKNNFVMHNIYSQALLDAGQLDEALKHIHESLRLNPECIEAHINAGTIYEMRGDLAAAETSYQAALQIEPERAPTLSTLALFYTLAPESPFRKPDEAVKLARKAAQLTAYEDPKILDGLALACWANGNVPEALQWGQKALELARRDKKDFLAVMIEKHLQVFPSQKKVRIRRNWKKSE